MDYAEKSLEHYSISTMCMLAITNGLSVPRTIYSLCTMTETGSVLVILGATLRSLHGNHITDWPVTMRFHQ